MEVLAAWSSQLQPYKETVASIATAVTVIQLLAPILMLNDIRKQKSASKFSILPFLLGGILSIMFIQFGQLIGDSVTVQVNLFGSLLSVFYILVFYYYTPIKDKFSVWTKIGAAGAFAAAMIAYTKYEDPKLVEQRFGLIITGFLYLLISFPMLGLKDVIRDKSTETLPFPMIFMGFIVSLSWLVYGIILNSVFVVFQNLFAVLLTGFQLSFFAIYPSKPKVKQGKKKTK